MLHDNLIQLRKRSGMSQEMMADRLHVVRQTVSKWERGVSVPDAEMLTKIADLFEVGVSDLLGEAKAENINEVAVQLALLNQQLANRSRRTRTFWQWVLGGALVIFVLWALVEYGKTVPTPNADTPDLVIYLTCTLEGETYHYQISCDEMYRILSYGGDQWVHENVVSGPMYYGNGEIHASVLIERIEEYFEARGGTVTIEELDPTRLPSPYAEGQHKGTAYP